VFDGRNFHVKRDDLLDPYLSGNKYRKLYTLINTPQKNLNKIISYGGTQSNAMLALAALCKAKEWVFEYYTKPLHIKATSHSGNEMDSNYAQALRLGMVHKELDDELYRNFIASLTLNLEEKSFVVHQGGADHSAKAGIVELANEIRESCLHAKCPMGVSALATPAGTGTTALYLALLFPEYKVYTTPSIGDKSYLLEQMSALEKVPDNLIILESEKKYHFAKPYKEFLELHGRLKVAGIEFDLIYAPKLWKMLLEKTDEEILYIHSGGTTGNASMLQRYKYKGLVSF
jgi:1-aminocyclopropane-1-carboxylate deaminase/D-cysteine desulfhydrase-like pyridoxal-dependent ACC family enzyme